MKERKKEASPVLFEKSIMRLVKKKYIKLCALFTFSKCTWNMKKTKIPKAKRAQCGKSNKKDHMKYI